MQVKIWSRRNTYRQVIDTVNFCGDQSYGLIVFVYSCSYVNFKGKITLKNLSLLFLLLVVLQYWMHREEIFQCNFLYKFFCFFLNFTVFCTKFSSIAYIRKYFIIYIRDYDTQNRNCMFTILSPIFCVFWGTT